MKDYIINAGFGGGLLFLVWAVLFPLVLIWAGISALRDRRK